MNEKNQIKIYKQNLKFHEKKVRNILPSIYKRRDYNIPIPYRYIQ